MNNYLMFLMTIKLKSKTFLIKNNNANKFLNRLESRMHK